MTTDRPDTDPPVTGDFWADAEQESTYQYERWGEAHDAMKSDADWLWLLAYLVTKAVHGRGDLRKQRHRLRAAAAALKHWDDQLVAGAEVHAREAPR